ncbi:NUDIX hydrolase [Marmoricola sp. URHB0036]|uniref:NUDIX domain-containing protein n=1 Tax=Marmoricola sp. URHB0036 TaxID=1298863 RepID=UPI00042892BB|nr:NUDIX hydrolase [Marmoricola sp. URHB0036]
MTDYPRIDVTVDVVALATVGDEQHLLVVRRGNPPFEGQWALPGGYLEVDEDLATSAARELSEETGLGVDAADLSQLGAYGTPDRDPRGRTISVAHVLRLDSMPAVKGDDDASAAQWVEVGQALDDGLAFDHEQIVRDALVRTT